MSLTNIQFAVLGRGAWGSALAATLSEAGRAVVGWSRAADDGIVAGCDIVICATPAASTREVLVRLGPHLQPTVTLIMAAKGLETGSYLRQSQIAREVCPNNPIAVLSGPGFADDLLKGLPSALTLASEDPSAEAIQAALATSRLRPYLSDDVVGVELGGALKNVIAIACGVVIGAGFGESARSAVLARGFSEMQRIALAYGAKTETLLGLAGLGDLTLTATSPKSRNYSFGLQLGEAGDIGVVGTVEGIATAQAAQHLAERKGLDVPIIEAVVGLLTQKGTVSQAAEALLARPLKRE